jgi:hypothetical protein
LPPDPSEHSGSAYFDEGWEPRLRDSLVLFTDLLGTRGVRAGADSLDHFKLVRNAVLGAQDASFSSTSSDATFRWFSDNLALGYLLDGFRATTRLAQMIAQATYLQVAFIGAGLLARGAIARGDFFADQTFVYGPALERAVVLEETRARYPRCILDEASIAIANYALIAEDSDGQGSSWRKHLALDSDGIVFVNYLAIADEDPAGYGLDIDRLLQSHKELIERGIRRYDGVVGVEEKFRWLAGYQNFAVRSIGREKALDAKHECHVSRSAAGFQEFSGAG